jgi:uncharacterized protein YcbX
MIKVGTIKEIWRYPVKGMAGESIQSCYIDQHGLQGDRQFAVRDVKRNEIQSCKFRPNLLSCIAAYNTESIEQSSLSLSFPDGQVFSSGMATEINQKISELLGHESTLETLRSDSGNDLYKRFKANNHNWLDELKDTFTREPGESLPDFSDLPQDFIDYVTLPGTFFLVSPCHIITTATMDHFKKNRPESDWDIQRFRPNILVETAKGISGLVEQHWLGKTLHIDNTSINCTGTAPRCGAITRKQQTFGFDKSMLRTIVNEAEQNLGIYGDISTQALIKVGSDVYLSE